MSVKLLRRMVALTASVTVAGALAGAGGAQAAVPPVKLVPAGHFTGTGADSLDVAVDNDPASPDHGDVFATDAVDHRVLVFTPAGAFVAMFGWEVNATRDKEAGATQAQKNVCTAESKDVCQAGVNGPAAGQLSLPESIAVDAASGAVYVTEVVPVEGSVSEGERVQKFTADGQFLLEIGKDVNHTTNADLCTKEEVQSSGVECAGPEPTVQGSSEHGAFLVTGDGNLLAVGGSKDLLYVGDEHRVQIFDTNGKWVSEIPLSSISSEPGSHVRVLALDRETGNLYLVLSSSRDLVREFDPEGQEIASFQVIPREAGREVLISGLAVDSAGRLAMTAVERPLAVGENRSFGVLYAAGGHRITEFTVPNGAVIAGIAFSGSDSLYADSTVAQEVLTYTPEPVAELLTSSVSCQEDAASALVTFDCTLHGEVNPEGVSETEVFFGWGRTSTLGEATATQTVAQPGIVQAPIAGLRPNETFYYQLAGYDQHVKAPEQLTSEQAPFATPSAPPRVVGVPSAAFVSSSSAVLNGEINPENTSTTYEFQYAPACQEGAACPTIAQAPGAGQTGGVESSLYGTINASIEASGLQPGTTYRYQLAAVNAKGQAALNETGGTSLPQGTFTTAAAPAPQVSTGVASGIASSTANLSGSVDPDGAPATYSFELGVWEGADTQYGVVSSGSAGGGTLPVEESLELGGLQPGRTYAFRVVVHSGYIHDADGTLRGDPVLFTTNGLPSLLVAPVPLTQVMVPTTAFPKNAGTANGKSTRGKGKQQKRKRKHSRKRKGKQKPKRRK